MDINDFDYHLNEELIAFFPAEPRDSSRLMVLSRSTGELEHKKFVDIKELLCESDVLVLNDTKVIPARLFGKKKETGGKIEVLLLKETQNGLWEALIRPSKRLREGAEILFGDGKLNGKASGYSADGKILIRFDCDGKFHDVLFEIGHTPLPPYIKRQDKEEDKDWYQTVYAERDGAVASPTAGLHFTKELLEGIKQKGVEIIYVTLHTGWGTFRPVRENDVREHRMDEEYFELTEKAAETINRAKKEKRRIIAVGTTTVRVLETVAFPDGTVKPSSGCTGLFIYPGHEFKVIDALITNFHLPKSTLLLLVSAFAGRERILSAYGEAIRKKYRFYSYGDAMFIKK